MGISPLRAFIVLVVFLVAVAALVDVGTRPPTNGEAAPPASTTTTTTASGSTTTTTTVPHSSVSVLVANATSTAALAAHYTTVLQAQGWALKTPVDATTKVTSSAVYYAAGQQAAAASIATTLGLEPHAVLALTTAVPVPGASGNDVVVVIGADLVTQAGT
ncbi:MAG TPA: LytR C-terminal domain-containing protein [Acidimicrobiales bacterium]|jgi:hypothetical protein|nr:LytR C-terminal domain-containing protein [Acidimicrobiales bacterium]